MAINPNMISFEGVGAQYVTFASALTSTDEGKPIKVSGNKTVDLAGTSIVHGKAIKIEKDGACVAQIKGYVELPYSGETAPTVGYTKLIGDGEETPGVVVDATNGREYLVLDVDTTNKIVGFIL